MLLRCQGRWARDGLLAAFLTMVVGGCWCNEGLLQSIPEPDELPSDELRAPCVDRDGDGLGSGGGCAGEDCDDDDSSVGSTAAKDCYPGPPGTEGVGACAAGVQTCTAGNWGRCQAAVLPAGESCDRLDNDCNGTVDDVVPRVCYSGAPGTEGIGACQAGQQTCREGTWEVCTGEVVPQQELCDGVDNDCDGEIDEEVSRYCHKGSAGTGGVGVCAMGTQTCTAGAWSECSGDILPSDEVCDGYDNDCDGLVDEQLVRGCYDGPAGSAGIGACVAGTQACVGAQWTLCVGQVLPASEVCDAVDNDCDGTADDGLVVSCFDGPAEAAGVGVCKPGARTCSGGAWSSCVGQVVPSAEVCDNLDNDCNGWLDDQLTRQCYTGPQGTRRVGVCTPGTETCMQGAWGACEGEVVPAAEVCDNLDNDCDGAADEAVVETCYSGPEGTAGVGECVAGSRTCTAGAWSACTGERVPAAEACDNKDNDCDGSRDESLVMACYPGPTGTAGVGVCVAGTQTCSAGSWGSCAGAVTPDVEICDSKDNNCDGKLDERIVRVSQSGRDQPVISIPAPADIIVLMDTSASMNDEIAALEQNLDVNLAQVLGQSALDYRVILIARFGSETHAVCIEQPLSNLRMCNNKAGSCPTFGPRFFHYNVPIESHDSLYRVITTFDDPDNCGLAPNGWSAWLRPEAFKHFIEITNDDPSGGDPTKLNSMNAASFDQNLLALSPAQFGTASFRRYMWHTIGGLRENVPADAPWLPADPLQYSTCTGNGGNVLGPGIEYQKLSRMTGGYRFPLCQYQSFDTMFRAIADLVINNSEMSCSFQVAPTSIPADSAMNMATLELVPTNGGPVQVLTHVANAAACSGMSFYTVGNQIFLCPAACQTWRTDNTALVDVLFTCTNQVQSP